MVYGCLQMFTDVYGCLWMFRDVYGCFGCFWMFVAQYGTDSYLFSPAPSHHMTTGLEDDDRVSGCLGMFGLWYAKGMHSIWSSKKVKIGKPHGSFPFKMLQTRILNRTASTALGLAQVHTALNEFCRQMSGDHRDRRHPASRELANINHP